MNYDIFIYRTIGCVARIIGKEKNTYPGGYAIGRNASNDKLLNKGVAGDYYQETMVVLNGSRAMKARKTNSSGIIEFSGLGFSKIGTTRNKNATYRLMFHCGAASTPFSDENYQITVKSRVNFIEIREVSTTSIETTFDSSYDLMISALIRDSHYNGIKGKVMTRVFIVDPSTGYESYSIIVREVVGAATNSKGILSMYFKFTMVYSLSTAYLVFEFDSVKSPATKLTFTNRRERPVCTTLFVIDEPEDKVYTASDNFTVQVQALSLDGSVVENTMLKAKVETTTRYSYPFPSGLVPTIIIKTASPKTNQNGLLNMSISLSKGYSGVYEINFLQPSVDSSVENTLEWCKLLNPIKIKYVNSIEFVEQVEATWLNSGLYGASVTLGTQYQAIYTVRNSSKGVVANQIVGISSVIYQLPPSYLGIYLDFNRNSNRGYLI